MIYLCSHTSDWWKRHVPCVCCGATYSDEEADQIADNPVNRHFTPEQQAIIDSIYWNHREEEK
jgi:hypothetical protein